MKKIQPPADMQLGNGGPHRPSRRVTGTPAIYRTHFDDCLLKLPGAHSQGWLGSDCANCMATKPWGWRVGGGDPQALRRTHDIQFTEIIIAPLHGAVERERREMMYVTHLTRGSVNGVCERGRTTGKHR